MATTTIPNFRDKHKYAFSEDQDKLRTRDLAEQCFADERFYDAIDFALNSDSKDIIEKIVTISVDEGDLFTVRYARKSQEKELSPELADKIGYNAYAKGKIVFAKQAFKISANEKMIAEIVEKEKAERAAKEVVQTPIPDSSIN